MPNKYNNGDQYTDDPKSMERFQDKAQNSRDVAQLSAEEIAAVLAETYFGGKVVGKENERDRKSVV